MNTLEAIKQNITIVLAGSYEDFDKINNVAINQIASPMLQVDTLTGTKNLKLGTKIRFYLTDKSQDKKYNCGDYGIITAVEGKIMTIQKDNKIVKKRISCYNSTIKKDITPAYAMSVQCLETCNNENKYATDQRTYDAFTKYFVNKDVTILNDFVKIKS